MGGEGPALLVCKVMQFAAAHYFQSFTTTSIMGVYPQEDQMLSLDAARTMRTDGM